MGMSTLIGGIFAIVVGGLGICVWKCQNIFISIPFIICSFLIGILCIVAGVAVAGGETSQAILDQACNQPLAQFGSKTGSEFFYKQYALIVDKTMCTDRCPCPEAAKARIMANYTDAQLREKFYRTYNYQNNEASTATSGNNAQNWKTIIGLKFMPSTETVNVFDTYKKCYEEVIKLGRKSRTDATQVSQTDEYKQAIEQFAQKGGFDYFAAFEDQYECASICKAPLFYITRSVSQTYPPEDDCATAFLETYSNNYGVAAAALVTAVILCLAGCLAIPIGMGAAKQKSYMDEK